MNSDGVFNTVIKYSLYITSFLLYPQNVICNCSADVIFSQ